MEIVFSTMFLRKLFWSALIFALFATVFFNTNELQAKNKGIVLESIEIEGTIQKPEAMYFLSRAKFSYRTLELNERFVEKVEKALYTEDVFK